MSEQRGIYALNKVLGLPLNVSDNGDGTCNLVVQSVDMVTGIAAEGATGYLHGNVILAPSGGIELAQDPLGTITIYAPTGGSAPPASTIDHNQLANLTVDDPHTQYLNVNGRTGGQSVSGDLILSPSATVHVGGSAASTGITLDVQSTTGGFGFPSMTTAQRNAIAPNRGGVWIWNSDNGRVEAWDGSNWYVPQTTVNGIAPNVTIAASGAAVVDTVGGTVYVYAPSGGGGSVTLTAGQVAYGSSANAVTSTPDLGYLDSTNVFYVDGGSKFVVGATAAKPSSIVTIQTASTASIINLVSPAGQSWHIDPTDSILQVNRQADDHIGYALDTASRFFTWDNVPTYMTRFANAGSDNTDPTTPVSHDCLMEIGNNDATSGNYSGVVFTNGYVGHVFDSGVVGVHENHSAAGSQQGHLAFITSASGTRVEGINVHREGYLQNKISGHEIAATGTLPASPAGSLAIKLSTGTTVYIPYFSAPL